MPRRTKQEAEATREAILQAATQIFVEKGVSGAGLEEIAKAAGVTRGAVYWHFKNKIDIFKALYDKLYTPFAERVLEDLEHDHPQPLTQLEQLCTRISIDLAADTQKHLILTIFFLRCDYSGEMEEIRRCQLERKGKSVQMFSEYFKRARAKGHLNADADPHVLTLALVSYLTGLTYEHLRNPEVFDLARYAPQMFAHFFAGLRKQDERP